MTISFLFIFISGICVAAASGLIGSFLVLRKMTLLSDALSHVALPGIALGIIFHFNPLFGGFLFLLGGVLLIWAIQNKTQLAIEAITGVTFVTALAVGSLLTPQTELLEAFFGSVEHISQTEAILQTIIALLIIVVTLKFLKPLILSSIAPELGAASHISQKKMELLLLVLIALTISIGIGFVGVLLMSALVIIPAATARNFSKNFKVFLCLSVALSVISLASGLILHQCLGVPPGVATVLASAFLFLVSLF